MKKKVQEEAAKKAFTLKGHDSKDISEEVIIESLETSTREEELRQAVASDQVPDEVRLEAVKPAYEKELQKYLLNHVL